MRLDQFPILNANLTGRQRTQMEGALQVLSKAVEAGGINNVAFQDSKSTVNRAFSDAWDKSVSEPFEYAGRFRDLSGAENDLRNTINTPQAHTVVGILKKLEKAKIDTPFVNAMISFCREVGPIAAAVIGLKDKVIKRQPKPVEDVKAKYLAPSASDTAMKQVYDLLKEVTDAAYVGLRQQFIDKYTVRVMTYIKASEKLAAEGTKHDLYNFHRDRATGRLSNAYEVVSDCVNDSKSFPMLAAATLKPDYKERIEKRATKVADEIREAFLIKNLKKLDSIVEKSGDLAEAKVVGQEVDLGSLRGTLYFKFTSGASFYCVNSVVWSQSKYQNAFLRFPLTFHKVTMSDGSTMPKPSEERMNTVFA